MKRIIFLALMLCLMANVSAQSDIFYEFQQEKSATVLVGTQSYTCDIEVFSQQINFIDKESNNTIASIFPLTFKGDNVWYMMVGNGRSAEPSMLAYHDGMSGWRIEGKKINFKKRQVKLQSSTSDGNQASKGAYSWHNIVKNSKNVRLLIRGEENEVSLSKNYYIMYFDDVELDFKNLTYQTTTELGDAGPYGDFLYNSETGVGKWKSYNFQIIFKK